EPIGRRDHFFALGGHSLLVMRVVVRVRQMLRRELKMSDLFAHPVLADLAQVLAEAAPVTLPPIVPALRQGPLPLSFAQQRLWFLAQLEGVSEAYHLSFGLTLEGELDLDALRRALDTVIARHEALRTTFVEVEGVPVQCIAAEGRFALEEQDLRGQPEAGRLARRLARQEARRPFDLRKGPLIRGLLLRLDEQRYGLRVTMHHIVTDGWSLGVLVEELGALYRAFQQGRPDPLPALPIQYADYAVWQRHWLAEEGLQQQEAYWTAALAGAPVLLSLPTDRPRPVQQSYAGGFVPWSCPAALTEGLKGLAQRHGLTLHMLLLGAWAVLLSRLSGQTDIVIGTPVANRRRLETEPLIGFFVNTLAIRVDVGEEPSVGELLARVKRQSLAAQQHQDLPFEQVVERVQPVRSLSHSPLFQVMLQWQSGGGRGGDALALPGLSIQRGARAEEAARTAKFDQTLSLAEVGERLVGGL
ncbi:condensation domain-containing protein, partial [Dyella flagellata]